ncbi:hypothetical protein AVEN_16583-1 [Araneus ventricosus]|uniref:Uncharacterized protein n=1 Tax=Araneus ventricosus TaxID=182803 RepID=A0A4Y2JRX3_ARAVE|nr:hypothetical protein AVEN_16583-1 [Araneus ventricosus]
MPLRITHNFLLASPTIGRRTAPCISGRGKRASLGHPASNPEDESSRPWTGSKLIPRPAAHLKSNSCYYRFGKLLLRSKGPRPNRAEEIDFVGRSHRLRFWCS